MEKEQAKQALSEAEFLEALAAAVKAKDGDAMAALAPVALSKARQKQMRKAVHRLKSMGVDVALPAEEPMRRAAQPASAEVDALVSATDGSGGRAVWLFVDTPGGGFESAMVMLEDERGLAEVNFFAPGRKQMRRIVKDLLGSERLPVARLSPGLARAYIEEAEMLTRARGNALPQGYARLHELLGRFPGADSIEPHPARGLCEAAGTPALREAARESAKLLDGPLADWFPSRAQVQSLSARIDQIMVGTVIVTPAQRREQVEEAFVKFVKEQIEGEGRARWVRRLLDSALVWERRGDAETARKLALVARALETLSEELPTFLVRMYRRPFESFVEQHFPRGREGALSVAGEPSPPEQPPKGKIIIPK